MADKTLYFFKQPQDFWHNHQIKVIGAHPEGKTFGKLCQLFYNKLITESVGHEGMLRFSNKMPYTPATLGAVLDEEPEFVAKALEWLEEVDVIEILEDKTIYIPIVEKLTESLKRQSLKRKERRLKISEEQQETDKERTMSEKCPTEVRSKKLEVRDKSIEVRSKNIEYFENEKLNSLFYDFLDFRITLKAKNTEKAITLLINKLNNVSENEAIEMIEESIANSWKSVFPLKKNKNNNHVNWEGI